MNQFSIHNIIATVVEKLPDRVRVDLASRDPHIRQNAEVEVSARIKAALDDIHALC